MQEQYKFNDCSFWSKYFDPTTCPEVYSKSKTQLVRNSTTYDSNYFVSRCEFAYFKDICISIDRNPQKSTIFSHDCTFLNNNSPLATCINFHNGNYVQHRVCSMNCNSSNHYVGLSFCARCNKDSNYINVIEDSSTSHDVAPQGWSIYCQRYGMISMKSLNISKCITKHSVCYYIWNEVNGQSSIKFCSFTYNVGEEGQCFSHLNSNHYIERCNILNNSEIGLNAYQGIFYILKDVSDNGSIPYVYLSDSIIKNNNGTALFNFLVSANNNLGQVLVQGCVLSNNMIPTNSSGYGGTVSLNLTESTERYKGLIDEFFVGDCYFPSKINEKSCICDLYRSRVDSCPFFLFVYQIH